MLLTLLALAGCRSSQTWSSPMAGVTSKSGGHSAVFNAETSPTLAVQLVSLESDAETSPAAGRTNVAEDLSVVLDLPQPTPITENTLPLTLDEAIGLGLSRNPDLASMRATKPVARAALGVAQTYIFNPQFQTQVLPYARDTDGELGSSSQQHVIVQTFELGGQQRHREGMAAANWRQVYNTVSQAELLNIAQTTRLFFAAMYQRELRDLNAALADMNKEIIGVIERREKAGQSNKADVELAKLQYLASRRQQQFVDSNYQTAVMNLRNQLNLSHDTSIDLAGQWMNWQWQPIGDAVGLAETMMPTEEAFCNLPLDTINESDLRQLVADRPDVLAARSAVVMASENLRLADANRRPNLQAGPLYQTDDNRTVFWGVQAQIDIPVVNTGKPLVRQRFAELRLQQVTATQLENRAILEASAAIQRYERARRLVEQSSADFNRSLSETLKPFEDQFKAGQITLLQVFAARTVLLQSQQSFFDMLNELTMATADVTQATGLQPTTFMRMIQSNVDSVDDAELGVENEELTKEKNESAGEDEETGKDPSGESKVGQTETSSLRELLRS